MSVGLVVVTHGEIGRALVEAAEFILDTSLESIRCVVVTQSGAERPDHALMRELVDSADEGEGVLLFTDLAGASPSNIAVKQLSHRRARVVSGVNLPMLVRAWNYRQEPLERLAELASEGGMRGIEVIRE